MALYPSFNPVAREKVPDYVNAEIWRAKIENDAKNQQAQQKQAMISSVGSLGGTGVKAYGMGDYHDPETGVKTGNKIGDWVGGMRGKMGLDPRANALREGTDITAKGGDPFNMPSTGSPNPPVNTPPTAPAAPSTPPPITGGEGVAGNIGSTSIPESLFSANPLSSQVSGPAFMPANAAAPEALTASLGAPASTSAIAAPLAEAGGAAALEAAAPAALEALTAGTTAATAGTTAATAATAAGTAGAGAAGAGAGLSAAAGPLAAMGPYGWAALAALAIGSQFM